MNWKEYVTEHEKVLADEEILEERLVKKTRIDHGQKKVQWVTDKPGYRVQYDKNHMPREVKISPQERLRRERAQSTRGKLNRKKTENIAQKKRERSFGVRDRLGIGINKDAPDRVTRRDKEGLVKSDLEGMKKREMEARVKKDSLPTESSIKAKIRQEMEKAVKPTP